MTLQSVPLQVEPQQSFSMALNGLTVGATVRTAGGQTFIDVICNGVRVAAGRACRDRTLLTPRAAQLGFPGLRLFFADLRGSEDPRWQDFGSRFLLLSETSNAPAAVSIASGSPIIPVGPRVGASGIFDGGTASPHDFTNPVINVGRAS